MPWQNVDDLEFQDILYHHDRGIARITINRPEVRNAFRPLTVHELCRAFHHAHLAGDIGAIILTGAGDLAFCAGGDQKVRGDAGGYKDEQGVQHLNVLDLQRQIRSLPKPVVAMVAGYAIGGGQVLQLICDLTIAADNARFGQTGPKVGSFDGGLGAGLLARTVAERPPGRPVLPCIRCSACADHCPLSLLPQQLYWYARAKDLDKVQEYELFDCIECGVCDAVCPSNIPLVNYFRFAKTAIYAQEREKQAADLARRRHEFRLERQERDKRERQERMKKKRASVSGKGAVAAAKKKAVIEAAMARAKAKREAAEPKNTDNLTPEQQAKINAIDQQRGQSNDKT